ncbi:hypothetical protein OGAPHI_001698 [Ogataea philodendri]|uniref:FAD dependent oxidoreductase domain-containing protein n=1 Tax=Ogataea philodendri TaxID=1378263 RepID=A0A9P8PAK2_9ASCO|nr:uncharacterized protein OGAPHI_001698 [Ogataea philodendri]KAH3667944.1 hypothetical protein OGAPHI_001698 [Ogataea philodendri]
MEKPILVIGAGTFGLSTALELSRSGYRNITCFDKYPVPSPIAAGNDSNKIINYGGIYNPSETQPPSKQIKVDAFKLWASDPVYKPHYHPVGFIYAGCSYDVISPRISPGAEYLESTEKIKRYLPVLTGPLTNWQGVKLNDMDGWLHARNALISAFEECQKLGVKFKFGTEGEITSLLQQDGRVEGVVSKSGKTYLGDTIILCAGPNVVSLFDFESQLQAKGFTLAHIKVTTEEAKKFKGLPVIMNAERGFFFEPDENDELKICNEFPGYINLNSEGESIPLFVNAIPTESADAIREFLRETMPEFSERPFVKTRTCWCTDSPDRQLILSHHPDFGNLILASGDSGLSFMLMPAIGKYVTNLVKGEPGIKEWKWRPETSLNRDDKQNRHGGDGVVKDLKDIKQWVSIENSLPHAIDFANAKM